MQGFEKRISKSKNEVRHTPDPKDNSIWKIIPYFEKKTRFREELVFTKAKRRDKFSTKNFLIGRIIISYETGHTEGKAWK